MHGCSRLGMKIPLGKFLTCITIGLQPDAINGVLGGKIPFSREPVLLSLRGPGSAYLHK